MLIHAAKNHRGSTLLMVIIVFALLLVFGMAALTLSANASRNAVTDYQTQQAYFTARSAVLAAVDYVKADADPKALLDSLDGKTSVKTTDPQLGEYTLTVDKLDDTRYQIASLAELDGVERAFYTVIEVASASTPFTGLGTVTGVGGAPTFENLCVYYGDIYISKDVAPFRFDGAIRLIGNLIVDNGNRYTAYFDQQIFMFKDTGRADDPENGNYNGAIISSGNVRINNQNSSEVSIPGGLYVKGTLAGGNQIPSGLKFTGTRFPSNIVFGEQDSQISNMEVNVPTGTPTTAPSVAINAGARTRTISRSGTVTTSFFSERNSTKYVFDTSVNGADLHIVFDSGNYTFMDQQIITRGAYKVYFYLKDNVQIRLDKENVILGDDEAISTNFFNQGAPSWRPSASGVNHPPRMTILSLSSSAKIYAINRSLLSAYVFIPNGEIEFGNDSKFCGSFIAGKVTARTQGRFAYIPPDDSGVPGGGGAGSGGITVVGNYSGQSKLVTP